MKIIILVLSAKSADYPLLENAIRKTWGSQKIKDVEIFYYHGNAQEKEIIGDCIYSKYPESYANIGYKTLDAFDLLKDKDFDYLFRTNSSSFVIQENLLDFLKDKPKNNFYCGIIGKGKINFCSGSGYFLSKDLLLKVLEHKNMWDHQYIDDVALGELLGKKLGILLSENAKRLDVNALGRPYTLDDLKNHYHIRCRKDNNRSIDIAHMEKIHKMLLNSDDKN